MDAAFVLVVAKRPGVQLQDRAAPSGEQLDLGFAPRHRLDRTMHAGALQVTAWHAEADPDSGAWHEGDAGLSMFAGQLRWHGHSWYPPDVRAARLARSASACAVDELQDELRGVFVAAHVDDLGNGWVCTDPLGLRCLYWGEDDDVVVIATRAALVARALSPRSRPQRDALAGCWLVFTGNHVGEGTGYRDVHVARQGDRLRLDDGTPSWEPTNPLVVALDDDLRGRPISELAEIVELDVAEALRAALDEPAGRHVIRLTGGKDSRLLLAAAVRAGLADAFVYETVGPPHLADVEIASGLCDALGLQHETRFVETSPEEPFATRFRRFVEMTGCMVSGWDLSGRGPAPGDLHLTGLCGEPLRRFTVLKPEHLDENALPGAFPRRAFSRLGLLRRDLADDLYAQVLDRLATDPHPSAHPLDRVHAWYAAGRMRFTRFGAREELAGGQRLHPLYSSTTVRVAMSMDPAERASELLFAEVMQRASSTLVQRPFTDKGWDPRALAHLASEGHFPSSPSTTGTSGGLAPGPAQSVMASIYADSGWIEHLAALFDDADNPTWTVLDRTTAFEALARYSELTKRGRYELFGAATAATWLAG